MTAVSTNQATCTVNYTPSAVGTQNIYAYYGAILSEHAPSSGAQQITANAAPSGLRSTSTALSCPAGVVNQPLTCTATVNDTSGSGATLPTGTVSVVNTYGTGGVTSSPCSLSGSGTTATCTVTYTPSQSTTHQLKATYSGDGTHATSSGTGSTFVNRRATTTAISCTPTTVDNPSTCTATVTDAAGVGGATAPTGSVSMYYTGSASSGDNGTCTLNAPSGNSNSCTLQVTPTSTSGSHNMYGYYLGSTVHTVSSGVGSVVVT
jgi:hypothetical protein